ncbi:MAG: type VI secretion system ATPase TssH, partial [Candidatus Kapabacteria bacterium]|nr:type VI secretion system ATPase TssH [Candidatus Kapabacteria bacterium]
MNFQKLTLKSQETIKNAQEIAGSYGNQSLEPIHLLAALIQDNESVATEIIKKIGADLNLIKVEVNRMLEKLPKVSGANFTNQYISNHLANVLDAAEKQADLMKDDFISVEHLLIALANIPSTAQDILNEEGVTQDKILAALKD